MTFGIGGVTTFCSRDLPSFDPVARGCATSVASELSTRCPAMACATCLFMRRSANSLDAPSTDSIQAFTAR